jgi:transcriptional regulator with PAS, ATPase and Fis domain
VEQPPEESRVAAKRAPSDDYLVVALECGRPLAGSARYALRNVDRVVIGRGDERRAERFVDGDLATLDARVPGLAPQHARLVRVGNGWAIEDLGSESGTVVNGVRVDCAVLAPDDIVELGHTLFRVLSGVATPEGTAEDLEAAAASEGVLATLDPTLTRRMEMSAKLATSSVPLLLLGESGTGKEVAARWLHGKTGRNGPFVAVNCGAIPTMLVESQLFGHVKGAFSGALRDEPGLIRAAEGGTLFLDEIGELPKTSQAALLRVLQEREVVPVGATRPVRVDFRLLAATNAPLGEMVERGEFRRDLLARIAGMTVVLPSLRERRFDVGMLVATLLRRLAGDRAGAMTFTPEAGRALLSYEWPFNVRELEQSLATCVALNGADGVV